MKRTTRNNSILVGALLGILVAGQAEAATYRYRSNGDYMALNWNSNNVPVDTLPGALDTIRCNWGNNTVTLTVEAPLINKFELGVDESGQLLVDAGGKLNVKSGSTVGNNNLACTGRLTVNTGGEVNVTNNVQVGAGTAGILTVNGGTVRLTSHLWVGSTANGVGTVYITNGGVFNVGGNIGLGTINASSASGGKGSVFVGDGGILNLTTIDGTGKSIWPNSVLDISGSGVVTKTGDFTAVMSNYTNALKITAYGGLGTVGIDYNNTNVGKTTLFAIAPVVPPPTNAVWNPAANPSGTGHWNENANWTGGVAPAGVTKVTFNVVGATPCTVTNAALADYVVMGDDGPGGTLNIAAGGSLTCGSVSASAIGYNSNAVMVVENGGSANFGYQLWIGLDPGSDGTLIMNGGTVSVANMFGLGWNGGKGTAQINGGTLTLAQWDDLLSIQGTSVLDVSGTGVVVINGNHQQSVNDYVLSGQITNHAGPGMVVVDYNNIYLGKTTIYPLGVYVAPQQVTWDPALNLGDTNGLWNVSSNWSGGVGPSNVTTVVFNVLDAIPSTVTNAASARVARMGWGGPGGKLNIANGGSLACSSTDDWNSIGYNNTALMVVENGGAASFGQHLWIGYTTGGSGTLVMNGGIVSVGQMFGLGWSGGTGIAQINGGTLNLAQWSASGPGSIAGASVLDVAGTGKVVITGNWVNSISNYVSGAQITANGGTNVFYYYDSLANKTIVSAVLLQPAPQQAITEVSVSGGNVTITYQTTSPYTYHIEGSPSLSPASWTPVAGSTKVATGAPVIFTFPASGGQMFYRTVSP